MTCFKIEWGTGKIFSMRAIAIDLGASSVRIMEVSGEDFLRVRELSRFPTPWYHDGQYERWSFDEIAQKVLDVLSNCEPCVLGIDGWGVDFGLLDERGRVIANPLRYRDPSHLGGAEELAKVLSREEHYALTGIQPLPFNTSAQLMARRLRKDEELARARSFAMVPDLLASRLTGVLWPPCERTNASTTQMLTLQGEWSHRVCEAIQVPPEFLPEVAEPGRLFGEWRGAPVVQVATHDTASAVLACPFEKQGSAYISSGTWSLVGVERDAPILTMDALKKGFTNEYGFGKRYRFLKNLTGLWLLERVRGERSIEDCISLARKAEPFQARFDVGHYRLINPPDMGNAIRELADAPLENEADLFRAIFENLARAYALVIKDVELLTGEPVEVVHIIGGGSQNDLLNQMTANSCGVPVVAGPVEATVIGNALVGFGYLGKLEDILGQGRQWVRASFALREFFPEDQERWREWIYGA
ncbi:MAG: FGGY-family carbohydrate kinase [Candidatus Caldarchaeum sp.]